MSRQRRIFNESHRRDDNMKRSMVYYQWLFERLIKNPDYENIIIGTGALARDMRDKLRLLGLRATFLIGERSDPENMILHYNEIAKLGDPQEYRFLVCCDVDEWAILSAQAQISAYKFLGNAAHTHPQLIRCCNYSVSREEAGKKVIDACNCNVILRDDRPYILFGDEQSGNQFTIHVLGSCYAGGIVRYACETYPELLQRELKNAGLHTAVYAWGQPLSPTSDAVMSFIRDISFFRVDMVILYHANNWDNIRFSTQNMLATRASGVSSKHPFIERVENTYCNEISNGIDQDVEPLAIAENLNRVFIAYSRLYGFTFWNIIPPTAAVLPEEQARALHKLSPGYFSRKRAKKDEILSLLGSRYAKDFSDTFAHVKDIFSMFADYGHLSSEGNRLTAQRCAAEILAAVGHGNPDIRR